MKILISMLYECVVNDIIISKQNPKKVYLVTVSNNNTEAEISRLKKKFTMISIEPIVIKEFDVVGSTQKINQIIKREKGNQIYVNVTEGRKTMVLAGVFVASINKEIVEGVYYLRQDNHELMPIPLPDFVLSETKLKILKELEKGITNVAEINKKVKVNRSLVYASIKELTKRGYIKKDKAISDAGKIALLAAENERER